MTNENKDELGYSMYSQPNDEISLKELLITMYNGRRIIASISLLCVVLAVIGILILAPNNKEARVVVSMSFDGINEGKNPDGSDFDQYQLLTPYVLSDTLKTLRLQSKISPSILRSSATITALIPDEVKKKQAYALDKEGTSFDFKPNKFIITVSTSRNTGIDEKMATDLANQIVRSYIKNFKESYFRSIPLSNQLLAFKVSDYDYADISMALHGQMKKIQQYNLALSKIDPDFKSKRSGMSFVDILNTVNVLDEVEMNKMDSLISSYKLTKNPEKLAVYYQYLIEQFKLQEAKFGGETKVSTDMLNSIENSSNDILTTLTGQATNNEPTTEKAASYFNSLILKTADIGTEASSVEQDIKYYEQELSDLLSGNYKEKTGIDSAKKEVETLVTKLFNDLNSWTTITNKTSGEYYEKLMTTAIVPLSPAGVNDKLKTTMILAVSLLIGLMLGAFITLFRNYWKTAADDNANRGA